MGDSSEFVSSVITDDLLLEILVRLPDARTVIQCATVCRRWRSMLLNPYFVGVFVKHNTNNSMNRDRQFTTILNYSNHSELPFYQLSLNQSKYNSEPQPRECDLKFLPPPPQEYLLEPKPNFLPPPNPLACDLVIRSCCDDLLLLSRGDRFYFVCNWLTKEWAPLPEVVRPPAPGQRRANFILCPGGSRGYAITRQNGSRSYKVVIVSFSIVLDGRFSFVAVVFDSDSATWSFPAKFRVPYELPEEHPLYRVQLQIVVAGGGRILHWIDGIENESFILASFNVFASEARVIRLPSDGQFCDICPSRAKGRLRLGVVRGRVRLSQMLENDERFGLKIWELDSDDDSWRLVHDVSLETEKKKTSMLFVLNFDPSDGNVIFLVRDKEIFRHELDRAHRVRVCEFPWSDGKSVDEISKKVAIHLNVLTLVHPYWPTSISSFPK